MNLGLKPTSRLARNLCKLGLGLFPGEPGPLALRTLQGSQMQVEHRTRVIESLSQKWVHQGPAKAVGMPRVKANLAY